MRDSVEMRAVESTASRINPTGGLFTSGGKSQIAPTSSRLAGYSCRAARVVRRSPGPVGRSPLRDFFADNGHVFRGTKSRSHHLEPRHSGIHLRELRDPPADEHLSGESTLPPFLREALIEPHSQGGSSTPAESAQHPPLLSPKHCHGLGKISRHASRQMRPRVGWFGLPAVAGPPAPFVKRFGGQSREIAARSPIFVRTGF